ncbi:hypothetical protein [Bradyrhizobium sp. BR 1433]|uniref:hypothetical protein n=1 Tax=Bradyrhizobium sp. BR 1433 TaxID=3447967 RepID=UPI003EE6EEBD
MLYEGSEGKGAPQIGLRLPPAELAAVDSWIAKQEDKPSRPEAIRRLLALTLSTEVRSKTESQRQHARDMAGEAIDKMADKAASSDERASRKRRLVKGPEEFQKVRRDRNGK